MARATIDKLIVLVRGLINDPLGAGMTFQDDDIQAQLDLFRTWQAKAALEALPNDDGSKKAWQSGIKYWENPTLTDRLGNPIVPETSDPISGYFTFDQSQDEVYSTGFTHDTYAAAAELLVMWAGRLESEIAKFSSDGSSYEFVSETKSKLNMAELYRRKSIHFGGIRTVQMVRDDTTY